MYTLAGSIILGLLAMGSALSAMLPVIPEGTSSVEASNQDAITQLSDIVSNMVQSDIELKHQLREATNALVESQDILLHILKGKNPGGVPNSSDKGSEDEALKKMVERIIIALGESSGGLHQDINGSLTLRPPRTNPVLGDILSELKLLNSNFQNHLTTLACPPPFVMLGSDCFNVLLEDLPWKDARDICLRMGADLAQPTDINQLKVYVGTKYPRKGRRNFWIGGVYREKEWQWLSGDPLDESYWHTNEPSGNGECLAMFDGWENPFTDFPCENERRAICKRS